MVDATTRPRLRAALAVLLFITAVAGCGSAEPARVAVIGQVLLDGTPLETGEVQFVPANGRPASASIESKGRFELASATQSETRKGVVPGKYRVAVSTVQIVDDETVNWLAPQKYADHRKSDIEFVIEKPTDSLIIDLSSDGMVDNEPVKTDQAESMGHEVTR